MLLSDRTFSILVEYCKYCYVVLLLYMSLRSIIRRLFLRQLSLRSIPVSFRVVLDRISLRLELDYSMECGFITWSIFGLQLQGFENYLQIRLKQSSTSRLANVRLVQYEQI